MGMSETLKAISDPVRRDILDMLKQERKSAGEIAEKFNLKYLVYLNEKVWSEMCNKY